MITRKHFFKSKIGLIYFSRYGHYIVNNTIFDVNSVGIFVHNSFNNVIENNLILKTKQAAIQVANDRISVEGQCRNNTFYRNKHFKNDDSSR